MKEEVLNPVHREAQGTSCLSFSPERVDKCGATCHAPAPHTTCWARAPGEWEDALHSLALSQHTLSIFQVHIAVHLPLEIHIYTHTYMEHTSVWQVQDSLIKPDVQIHTHSAVRVRGIGKMCQTGGSTKVQWLGLSPLEPVTH